MAMENGPVEDVFPTENGDFPASHVSLLECNLFGGFTPSEKYQSNWIISPSKVENKQYLKPPPILLYPQTSRIF